MKPYKFNENETPREMLRKTFLLAIEVAKRQKHKAFEDVMYWRGQIDSRDYERSARTKKNDKERLDSAWSRWYGATDVVEALSV